MFQLAPGWRVEAERGPDWLFLRLHGVPGSAEKSHLCDHLWSLVEQHLTYRVVLELDDLDLLKSVLLGELISLQKRIDSHDGVLRLCGLSQANRDVLAASKLNEIFPTYDDRHDAVMCTPKKPR